jgi:hypothetical protein
MSQHLELALTICTEIVHEPFRAEAMAMTLSELTGREAETMLENLFALVTSFGDGDRESVARTLYRFGNPDAAAAVLAPVVEPTPGLVDEVRPPAMDAFAQRLRERISESEWPGCAGHLLICEALALAQRGNFAEALGVADRVEALAAQIKGEPYTRAKLLGLVGRARADANSTDAARQTLARALTEATRSPYHSTNDAALELVVEQLTAVGNDRSLLARAHKAAMGKKLSRSLLRLATIRADLDEMETAMETLRRVDPWVAVQVVPEWLRRDLHPSVKELLRWATPLALEPHPVASVVPERVLAVATAHAQAGHASSSEELLEVTFSARQAHPESHIDDSLADIANAVRRAPFRREVKLEVSRRIATLVADHPDVDRRLRTLAALMLTFLAAGAPADAERARARAQRLWEPTDDRAGARHDVLDWFEALIEAHRLRAHGQS